MILHVTPKSHERIILTDQLIQMIPLKSFKIYQQQLILNIIEDTPIKRRDRSKYLEKLNITVDMITAENHFHDQLNIFETAPYHFIKT